MRPSRMGRDIMVVVVRMTEGVEGVVVVVVVQMLFQRSALLLSFTSRTNSGDDKVRSPFSTEGQGGKEGVVGCGRELYYFCTQNQ